MASKSSKTVIIIISIVGGLFVFACVGLIVIAGLLSTSDDSSTKETSKTETTPTETSSETKKAYKLKESQQGDYWKYTPKAVKRTTELKDEFSSKKAGTGQEYLLLNIEVKNITNKTQNADLILDPQPKILSGKQEYDADWDAPMYTNEKTFESGDVAPGGSQGGWIIFKIPVGKKDLKLKIEDFVWDLGF